MQEDEARRAYEDEDRKLNIQYHTRRNSLTEHDIEDIVKAMESKAIVHSCRFNGVTEEDFYESVKFFKYLNSGLTSGRNIIAKTVLVLLVTVIFGILGIGIVTKVKGP